MTPLILLSALLAGPSAPAAAPVNASASALRAGAETPAWTLAEGARLRVEFESRHRLTAERDERITAQGSTLSQRTFDLSTTVRLAVVDRLEERDGERPLRFTRVYETSAFDADTTRSRGRQQTKDDRLAGTGSVEGTGVVFTWVPEEGEYGRYFDRREGAEESLPGLEADLTLRGLLPAGPVEPGASWEPAVGALRGLLTTGGDQDYEVDEDQGLALLRTLRVGLGMNLEQAFGGSEEGELRVTWIGVEEVEGRRLALLDVDFDVVLEHDVTARAAASSSMDELARGMVVEAARVRLALRGGGRLRWDLAGGHLHDTVDLAASERCRLELTQRLPGEGDAEEPATVTQVLVMAGRLEHSIRCTRLE